MWISALTLDVFFYFSIIIYIYIIYNTFVLHPKKPSQRPSFFFYNFPLVCFLRGLWSLAPLLRVVQLVGRSCRSWYSRSMCWILARIHVAKDEEIWLLKFLEKFLAKWPSVCLVDFGWWEGWIFDHQVYCICNGCMKSCVLYEFQIMFQVGKKNIPQLAQIKLVMESWRKKTKLLHSRRHASNKKQSINDDTFLWLRASLTPGKKRNF